MNPCPHCGHTKTHKHGDLRFKCPVCGKTFRVDKLADKGRPAIGDRPMTGYERLKKALKKKSYLTMNKNKQICQTLSIGSSTVELSLSEDIFTLKYDEKILYQTRNRIFIEYFHDGSPFGALCLREQDGHFEHIDPITGQVDYKEPKFKQFHIPVPGLTLIKNLEKYQESERIKAKNAALIDSIPDESRKKRIKDTSEQILNNWETES